MRARNILAGSAWIVIALVIGGDCSPAGAASQSSISAHKTYIDKGACPFECCTYRRWTTTKPVTLQVSPGDKTLVAAITAHTDVDALTGEVISHPLAVVATENMADTNIRRGDIYYVLHYEGEGVWKALFRGRVVEIQTVGDAFPDLRDVWWVKIRTAQNRVGWAVVNDNFTNQDACG